MESGLLDSEEMTQEFEVAAGDTFRIVLDGSFNNPKVLDPDERDLLGNMIITDTTIPLTPAAEQSRTHKVVLVGSGSYEIYIEPA
jgi:hypothetical protein